MRWLILATVLLLGACATNHQEACAAYGFKPGTDAFANCLMTREAQLNDAISQTLRDNEMRTNAWAQQLRSRTCIPMGYGFSCY